MDHTHAINLTRQTIEESGLFIEQENYGRYDGFLSLAGMYNLLFNLLDGELPDDPECYPDCGTNVYVYRYDLTLNYKLYVSYGSLGQKIQEETFYIEKVRVSMESEVGLKYPCFGEITSRWLGDKVWDKNGREIATPSYTVEIDKVVFDEPVYGTLLLAYKINRDAYALALPKREGADQNKYTSVAYAIYSGGPTWLELEPPPGAEETDQQCKGGGGGGTVNPPEPEDSPPYAPNVDAKKVIDYCTQEVTSDNSIH